MLLNTMSEDTSKAQEKVANGTAAPEADSAAPGGAGDKGSEGEQASETVDGANDLSLEQLQEQLKAMEEEQTKLAAEFEQVNEAQKLEPHLAVIEEQFRLSFDDRFSAHKSRSARPVSFISTIEGSGELDLIKLNGIFRDVSRDLGDEWKPVFVSLTEKYPQDIVTAELEKIEKMQPIIRGYRSLNVWKEIAGPDFNIRDLMDVLRKHQMDDIADSVLATVEGVNVSGAGKSKAVSRRKSDVSSRSRTAVLDNRRMLLLAKKVGSDWEPLAKALELPEEEISEIKEGADSDSYQGAFKALWAWRQTQPDVEQAESIQILKSALVKANKQALADQLGDAPPSANS